MIDRFTAETQARISYVIFGGYFVLKVLEGFKLIEPVSTDLKELMILVGSFWFMRSRTQEKPSA